jgi:hypothetical protein
MSWRRSTPPSKPGQCPKVRQLERYEECRKRVCAKLAEHYLAERRNLPSHLKPCLPSSVKQTVLVLSPRRWRPSYQSWATRVVLLYGYRLPPWRPAHLDPARLVNLSALCATNSRSPLRTCSTTAVGCPPTLAPNVRTLRRRAFEVRYASDWPLKCGLATTVAETWSASFVWEGRSHHTTARLLWLVGRMIDYCSNQVAPVGPASPEGRPRRLVSASRLRPCHLSPVCRGRFAKGRVVPSHAG